MIDNVAIGRTIDDVQRFLSKAEQGGKFYAPLEEVREYIENLEDKLRRTEIWGDDLIELVATLNRDIDEQNETIERLNDRADKAKKSLDGQLER